MSTHGGMLPAVKPETLPNPDDEAELRAAIDAAERDALLSPEAFLRWLEAQGDEPEKLD